MTNWTLGCAKFLPMRAGDVAFKEHAHVVKQAPFRLLLGRPFQHALLCRNEDLPSGDVEVSVSDPTNPSHRISIPFRPRKVQAPSVRILSLSSSSQPQSWQPLSQSQSFIYAQSQSPSQSNSYLILNTRQPLRLRRHSRLGYTSCLRMIPTSRCKGTRKSPRKYAYPPPCPKISAPSDGFLPTLSLHSQNSRLTHPTSLLALALLKNASTCSSWS